MSDEEVSAHLNCFAGRDHCVPDGPFVRPDRVVVSATLLGDISLLSESNDLMMIDWVLMFVRDLALAIWLGGLIIIDFVETPTRFRVPGMNRNQVVAVGREVFTAFNRTETITGTLLIAVSALLLLRAPAVSTKSLAALISVGAMWLVALLQYFWARPRMSAATKELDLVNRQPGDARFDVLRRWHRTYVALDLVKMALGLAALGLWL